MYLKPLMVSSGKINYDVNSNININTTCNDSVNYTYNKFYEYVINNDCDESILRTMNDKVFMVSQALSEYNFNSSIKDYIVIATMLSSFEGFNLDLDDFVNLSDSEKEIILTMINYVYTDINISVSYWMLIPKYITILSKISKSGIINFVSSINNNSIYNELNQYIKIIKNYTYNFKNKYIDEIMKNCIKNIAIIDKINNCNITINDICEELE
jgi:urate oxidase